MKKDELSYEIIYENIKGKKDAINEIEGICPCCGKDDNLETEEKNIGPYKQMIYKCDCGTKWRGNCYNENSEIVSPKQIKKYLRKEKFSIIPEFFSKNAEVIILITIILVIAAAFIGIVISFKNDLNISTSNTSTNLEEVTSTDENKIKQSDKLDLKTQQEIDDEENLNALKQTMSSIRKSFPFQKLLSLTVFMIIINIFLIIIRRIFRNY